MELLVVLGQPSTNFMNGLLICSSTARLSTIISLVRKLKIQLQQIIRNFVLKLILNKGILANFLLKIGLSLSIQVLEMLGKYNSMLCNISRY